MKRQRYYSMEVSEKGRFVYLPIGKGLYRRCHVAAWHVDCPEQNCQAAAKEPCYNMKAWEDLDVSVYQTPCHPKRTMAYRQMLIDQKPVDTQGRMLRVLKGKKARQA